jgi:phytoene synthase
VNARRNVLSAGVPAVPTLERAALSECRAVLEQHAKSFSLATKLLPRASRDQAAALYAYCRRVDDAIDECPAAEQAHALARLSQELEAIYRGGPLRGSDQRAFQALVSLCQIPECYPRELLAGMASDAEPTHYETLTDLLLYCHRVAGVVGLMMCHVFGVTRDSALSSAAQLGIAMQLTNICRDVAEDMERGRMYLPARMLREANAGAGRTLGVPHGVPSPPVVRSVVHTLLGEADRYYRAAERGIDALPFRAGLAVRAARYLYAGIGDELRRRDCDPLRGRVYVRRRRKLLLLALACGEHLLHLPLHAWERWRARGPARLPRRELAFPEELLP